MAINFCSSKKQDLFVPQNNLYNTVGRKLSAMNMATCIVKGSSKNKDELAFRCTEESLAKMRADKTASMLIHDTKDITQKIF